MTKIPAAMLAALILATVATPAEAKRTRAAKVATSEAFVSIDKHAVLHQSYSSSTETKKKAAPVRSYKTRTAKKRSYTRVAQWGGSTQIVAHPAGCPRSRFCGCGTSLYLLGRAVSRGGLAIAANWLAFPRAEPGPGTAAARRGHVFAIIQNLGNGKVLAYDPNSGGRKTRIHVRSLAGYTVVRPTRA